MMTINDFDIVVSTVPESDRMDRLFRYFHAAGICRFMLDYEPKFTGTPPIEFYMPGGYGCSQHFCKIQAKMLHRDILYFEDDAKIEPDFCEMLNRHIAELPDDWRIFAPGYIWVKQFAEKTEGANWVSPLIRRNARKLCGTQCLLLRAGEWRKELTDNMLEHWFYGYDRSGGKAQGFDKQLAGWCRATGNPFYFAAQSFVVQEASVSLISGHYRKQR